MRRLSLIAVGLLLATGCQRKTTPVETIEEPSATLATMVHVADPATAGQLVSGFYDVEQNSWRWTMGKFSVALRPPAEAAQKGANLVLRFSIPEPVFQRLGSVTVSATVDRTPLGPESFGKPGDQVYRREVPPAAFTGQTANVSFALDKVLPAGSVDQRELGIVVSSIGFEAK
jgi:hypothetical protein